MNTRAPILLIAVATALLPACKAPDCEKVVDKTVQTMVAEQGDKSMLKTEHIPKIVEGCKASNTMETHSDTAKCIVGASDFATLKECKDIDAVLKAWLKAAK
jgi:hypothetical protein